MPPFENVETLVKDGISITGLDLAKFGVGPDNGFDADAIIQRIGKKDPDPIIIPYNTSSIADYLEYWPVLCLMSTEDLQKVHTKATLKKGNPTDVFSMEEISLKDDQGEIQKPFPRNPDYPPKNLYHRWWRWPGTPSWREPGEYTLNILIGYNRYNAAPDKSDWISKPISYKITIENEKLPKDKSHEE